MSAPAPRFEDWPERMHALVARFEAEGFVWGERDCALVAADFVEALTGFDPAEVFRGRYKSRRGALRACRAQVGKLVKAGEVPSQHWEGLGGFLRALVVHGLGEPLSSPAFARRGDVVGFDDEDGELCLGVCLGREIGFLHEVEGWSRLPRERASIAWRV